MSAPAALRRPEVLAPVGDAEAMRAAIRAGASAVYFGLHGFQGAGGAASASGLNARARARNFDVAELSATMRTLHEHGVRGYVTLNTLVFDNELAVVEAAVRACAAAGADAVIVQDLGVARLVRAIAPELPIHASTQMTCTDAASVAFAREMGASRVILARELSLTEIAAIRAQTDVELEVFVHGALCIAYSGQCLTSEAIGGRSANRGACAQACRLPYELVVDGELRDLGDRAYLLSPEDLEASALVPELVALGISALKIEGRLKGPSYVAATTRLYQRAIDAALGQATAEGAEAESAESEAAKGPSDEERSAALQMFSRGSGPGFLAGVDHQRLVEGRACDHRGLHVGAALGVRSFRGKPHLALRLLAPVARGDGILVEGGFAGEGELGGRVWDVIEHGESAQRAEPGSEVLIWLGPDRRALGAVAGRRVFKTSDPARDKEVEGWIEREPHRIPTSLRVSGRMGELPVFEASHARGAAARVLGDVPLAPAQRAPLTPAILREQLGRLGETPFSLASLEIDLPDGAMLPLSSLNRARRALTQELLAASQRAWGTTEATHQGLVATALPPERAPLPAGLFVLCRTLEQAEAALDAGAAGVYLDFLELTGTGVAVRALRQRGPVNLTLAPPRIRKPGEEKIDRYLRALAPDALLVRGLGALAEGADDGIARIGDFSLNVTNRLTAAAVLGRGLSAFTPSFDLDAAQLGALLDSPFAPFAEVVVHHPMPLFHMEHCVIAALLSEGRDHLTCGRPCDRQVVSLRDRAGMDHPVEADVGCRNTVFHASPQSAADLVPALVRSGVRRFRIELVREGPAEVTRVVQGYLKLLAGEASAAELWRALRAEAGYGVVRGSLRVLSA